MSKYERLKEILSTIGWILLVVLAVVVFFGLLIVVIYLCAWIAEQLGIPYVWVL